MRCHAKYGFLSTLLLLGLVSTFSVNPKPSRAQLESLNPSNVDEQLESPSSVVSKPIIHSRTSEGHLLRRRKKRNLSRRAGPIQDVSICDGTFYKQTRVDRIAANACTNARARAKGGVAAILAKIFSSSTKPFPNNNNLFNGRTGLTMTRISKGLFTGSNIKSFFKIGKNDYVVLSSCKPVAVVRQISNKDFTLCNKALGGP